MRFLIWVQILCCLVLAWTIVVYIFFDSYKQNNRIRTELKLLNQQKERLGFLIKHLKSKKPKNTKPKLQYEVTRRRIERNIASMWNYFDRELSRMINLQAKGVASMQRAMEEALQLGSNYKRALLYDMQLIQMIDGFKRWRQKEANDLSDLMQRRLNRIQHPKDCAKARKLLCRLDSQNFGFGAQMHHLAYCFIVAYATERTFILHSEDWNYHNAGWEDFFKPLSENCTTTGTTNITMWPATEETQVVELPLAVQLLRPQLTFLPQAVPADLAKRLKRLHGFPFIWWVGHILKFILRPKPTTLAHLYEAQKRLGWKRPIVGVHVRRTDKIIVETRLRELHEYMLHVEDYYRTLELNSSHLTQRRIFLATDDPSVIEEAYRKYPQYEIIANAKAAHLAANMKTRFTDASLMGVLLDLFLLSLSDYIVCTLSSSLCRLVYEIMQNSYPDATNLLKSLDDIYYYDAQQMVHKVAIIPHMTSAREELDMEIGDIITVSSAVMLNGYLLGNQSGYNDALFPVFKVESEVRTAQMPIYKNV